MSLVPHPAAVPDGILSALVAEAHASGESLVRWGIAWARVLPTVLLVPAFGLVFLPLSLRVVMGFVLAVSVAPAIRASVLPLESPWPVLVLVEILRGLPVALTASVSLWAATVAGGVADVATGAQRLSLPKGPFGRGAPPFETLLGLLAGILFLDGGGATWALSRLVEAPTLSDSEPLRNAVFALSSGIGVGVSIGAPLLVVAVVVDVATLLAAREVPTLRGQTLFAPVRALVVLIATAVLLDRMVEAGALFAAHR